MAYNINLNTTSTRRANAIAFDIREAGRIKREGNPLTGKVVKDADGEPARDQWQRREGIGWYIEGTAWPSSRSTSRHQHYSGTRGL